MWRTIDSAPKDGKQSLLLARFDDRGVLCELDFDGAWGSYSDGPNGDDYLYWDWLSNGGIERPTHWMIQPDIDTTD